MDLQDGLKSSLNKLRIRSRNRGSFRNKHLNIGCKTGGYPLQQLGDVSYKLRKWRNCRNGCNMIWHELAQFGTIFNFFVHLKLIFSWLCASWWWKVNLYYNYKCCFFWVDKLVLCSVFPKPNLHSKNTFLTIWWC